MLGWTYDEGEIIPLLPCGVRSIVGTAPSRVRNP